MRRIHYFSHLILVAFSFALVGCAANVTVSPYPNPVTITASSISTPLSSTLTPSGKYIAPTAPGLPPQSCDFGQGDLAEIESKNAINYTEDELFILLVSQWLQKHKTGVIPTDTISDYRIDEVTIIQGPKKEFKAIAWINFSVQPVAYSGDWASITVRLSEPGDPWTHVGGHFGIYQDGNSLKLKFLPGWGT
ncbi:MAG: hypothetical protein ACOY0R_04800 [Chloroflexota bacterium]